MSAAPTNPPPTEDPWQVPAPMSGAKKTTKTAQVGQPGRKPLTAQQVARDQKVRQSQARIAARMTWPLVVRLTLTGVVCRVVTAAVLVVFSIEDMHLHGLLASPTTTYDQWDAALRTAHGLAVLNAVFGCALVLPISFWARVRVWVSKLPGVAPHPMQSSNHTYRTMNVPAYWPPVPMGVASWTRRIHWRVPPGITAAFMVLLTVANSLNRWVLTAPLDRYRLSSVVDLVAAALALAAAALDVVRLREYKRWPGRPAR